MNHPYNHQNETIPLVTMIIIWSVISVFVLFKQYVSIKLFYDFDERLFHFSTKRVSCFARKKMEKNDVFIESFNPKKTISIINIVAFAIYLAVLNLVLQYDKPEQKNDMEIEMNVKDECKQVSVKVTESDSCKTK